MGKLAKLQRSKRHKKLKKVNPSFYDQDNFDSDDEPVHSKEKRDEDIPPSLRKIMNLKKKAKSLEHKKKPGRRNKFKDNFIKPSRPMQQEPVFIQGETESHGQFLNRMDQAVTSAINRAKFEETYDVEFKDKSDGGLEVVQQKKEKSAHRKEKEKLRLAKRKARKSHKEMDMEFEPVKDEVMFGEVAMEPPKLSAKPRKSQKKEGKPGNNSLLLKTMLDRDTTQVKKKPRTLKRELGKTIKRKHMTIADRRIMDGEREKAVQRYREMKQRRLETLS